MSPLHVPPVGPIIKEEFLDASPGPTAMQTLKHWLEGYLGIPPTDAGEGTAWNFNAEVPWPAWVPDWAVLIVVLGVILFIAAIYLRDARSCPRSIRILLIGLRLGAVGMVLLFLTQLTLAIDRTGLPFIVVMVDDSASMGLEDQYRTETASAAAEELLAAGDFEAAKRFNLAQAILTRNHGQFLRRLQEHHKLRVYRFSKTAVPFGETAYIRPEQIEEFLRQLKGLRAQGEQTRPGPSVRKVLDDFRGTPPSAIIVLTDGITSTTAAEKLSTVAELARSRLVPIFPVGIGSRKPARDLRLYDMLSSTVAFAEDPITFSAKLEGHGFSGKRVPVRLKDANSSKILAEKRITIPAEEGTVEFEVTYTPPEEGEFDYTLQAGPLPNEVAETNNAETRHVSVRDEQIRVLLADSKPRYEFRYIKHLLERNGTVELDTVLQEADLEYAREDQTALEHFPVKSEKLLQYDVIIFGDVDPGYLSSGIFGTLRDFVRQSGGGLLLIAGPQHNPLSYRDTPLEVLLPIRLQDVSLPNPDRSISRGFRPRLTVDGRHGTSIFRFAESEQQSRQIWAQLPELYWLCQAPQLKPGAVVFAEHPTRMGADDNLPVIAMQRFGAGKVLFHATDELWRWRFRAGDLYYGRYWIQAVRYLSRSKLLGHDRGAELSTDRLVYQRGDPVKLRLRFLDERLVPDRQSRVEVMVEQAGGTRQSVRLKRLPQALSVFEGRFTESLQGSYHAWVVSPSFDETPPATNFRVESPRQELRDRSLDRADLVQTAQATRGRYFSFADVEKLLDAVPRGQPVPLETEDPLPLWNRPEMLVLFVAFVLAEWLLRKRYRLI